MIPLWFHRLSFRLGFRYRDPELVHARDWGRQSYIPTYRWRLRFWRDPFEKAIEHIRRCEKCRELYNFHEAA